MATEPAGPRCASRGQPGDLGLLGAAHKNTPPTAADGASPGRSVVHGVTPHAVAATASTRSAFRRRRARRPVAPRARRAQEPGSGMRVTQPVV